MEPSELKSIESVAFNTLIELLEKNEDITLRLFPSSNDPYTFNLLFILHKKTMAKIQYTAQWHSRKIKSELLDSLAENVNLFN